MSRAFVGGIAVFVFLMLFGCGGRDTGSPALPATKPAPPLKVGGTYPITVPCFGGATEEVLDRGQAMVEAKNAAGLNALFLSGELVRLERGKSITVEELTPAGKAKVRAPGISRPLWIHQVWAR